MLMTILSVIEMMRYDDDDDEDDEDNYDETCIQAYSQGHAELSPHVLRHPMSEY